MVKTIRYGFKYKGINYGWLDKKLYRLPSVLNLRNFPFKELNLIKVGNKKGYNIRGVKKTINQLQELTEVINYEYVVNGYGSNDCPF